MPQSAFAPSADVEKTYTPWKCQRLASDGHRAFTRIVVVGIAVFLIWASFTELNRVTRGDAMVIPFTENQTVQHLEGGILSEILVKEGDFVEKGDLLVRVKDQFSDAELAQSELDRKVNLASQTRLSAEANGDTSLLFDPELLDSIPQFVENEMRIFEKRLDRLNKELFIIDDQIRQNELQFDEQKARLVHKIRENELISQRLDNLKKLNAIGAVSTNEILNKESELQRTLTDISDLQHRIPSTESKLVELHRKRKEADLRHRIEAEKELGKVELKIAQLDEAISAMKDRTARTDVTAPISGRINSMFVSTVGGVIQPGQHLMQIVPNDTGIAVEAQVSPKDRADLWVGLPTIIKITAYDYTVYGGVDGVITEISPDAIKDEKGQPFFRVRIEAQQSDFGKDKPIVPGMAAVVDILNGKHTVMEYLLTPIKKLQENALRQ